MKIVGNTVGTTMPRPDWDQNDPKKGSFIKNKPKAFESEPGATFTPHVDENGNLSWTNDQNLPNPEPVNIAGPQGPKGADGTMTFEDLTDEQRESLRGPKGEKGDTGPQGPQGEKGEKGADGTMTFEDLTEEQKSSMKGDKGDKGDTGPQGPKGDKGDKGDAGEAGVSPTVTIQYLSGCNKITITDAAGSKTIDVFDGKNGDPGYSPVRGNDYWTPDDIAQIKSYVDNAILGGAW